MPPNSKKARRKGKSKQNSKKVSAPSQALNNVTMQTQLYDEEGEYPSSRVIKRAPNGDVIVESLPVDHGKKQSNAETIKNMKGEPTPMAFTLDSHWESLTPEEKKDILRIEKDEVFDVIRNYQNNHGCNCSVCGRRHMAMDQEMERIYNTLYDIDKERDPEINPVKFHLSIIKELQNSKIQQQQAVEPQRQPSDITASDDASSIEQNIQNNAKNEFENMRDEVVKYFLSSTAADNLKEEVMHFKQIKKQQQLDPDRKEEPEEDHSNTDTNLMASPTKDVSTCAENDNSDELPPVVSKSKLSSINDADVQAKYLKFAKTFVSSHPKIAEEYVNRMIMYPDMRALTDDLMNNNGQGFVKAIENFVMQKQQETPQSLNGQSEVDISRFQHLSDAKDFTTMLHNGKPLTPEEYGNLQRHVAERMTNSYDTQKKEFKEVSQLERELFTRFMFGEDRKTFGDLIMQSFREKFDDQYGNAAISASLAAAAAATTVSPIVIASHDEGDDDYGYDEEADDDGDEGALENNEFDETYDDYSEYDDEEGLEDEGQDDMNSEFDEEEEDNELPLQLDELDHHCSHPEYDEQYHSYHNHEKNNQNSAAINDYSDHHYHHRHGHEDEFDEGDEDYDSSLDETERLEEGRKLIQIAITKLLQGRIMESYHEKEAENNRLKLLQELEAEEQKKKAKEEKKQKKREKEKEKKKAQQLAKEEGKRKKEEEAEMLKKEAEEREKQRREVQRKKVEESNRKKDEEKRRKLEEQRRREEEQEHQRKLKEEMKRKRDEEKRLKEEERMQREDEKRKKEALKQREELNKKKEEKRRLIEENKAEEQEQLLKRQREDFLIRQNKEHAAIHTAQTAHFQYSNSPSNNMAFGNTRQSLSTQHNSSDVSDDILSIISSAAASKPLSSSAANLPTLLNAGNDLQHEQGNTQSILPSSTPLFATPNLMGSKNFSGENMSLDSLSCMHHPASSSQNSTSPGLAAQPFGMPSWNSFAKGSVNGLEHNHREVQQAQQVPPVPSFVLNNTEPNNEKYYAEEINNLSNILSSAGLQEAPAPSTSTFGQPSLWDVQRSSISVPISGNVGSAADTASGIHIPGIPAAINGTPKMATATEAALMNNGNQHSSIWDNTNGSSMSSKPGDISGIENAGNNSSSNYANSSIWGTSTPSSMSFLDNTSNVASTNPPHSNNEIAHSNKNNNDNHSHHSHYNNNHVNGNHNADDNNDHDDDAIFIESIYKTYLMYAATQGPTVENQYVLASLLHQNSLCCNSDYSRFIDYLLSMRSTHGCQLATNASGSITHVRLLGAQQNIINNTSRTSRDPILNEMYHRHAGDIQHMPTTLLATDGSPSLVGTSFGPRASFNSQLSNVGQHMNPSSLAGNIWG